MNKKLGIVLGIVGLLVAVGIYDATHYDEAGTRVSADLLIDYGATLVCAGISNAKPDAPVAEGADGILRGLWGYDGARDLTFVEMGSGRFKFALRDRARFLDGLAGGLRARRAVEQRLTERVIVRSAEDTAAGEHCSDFVALRN
jgi:hypothetical protein